MSDETIKDVFNERLETACTQDNINEVIRTCLKDNVVLIHPDPMQESAIRDVREFCDALQHKLRYVEERNTQLVTACNINSVWNGVNTAAVIILAVWACWVLF